MPLILKLFCSFLKIGAFTLGGGYAMLSLIQHEIVEKRNWLSESEFFELLAMAQSSPGPIAVNTAVFVGYKTAGFKGACASTFAIVLPSVLIILLIAAYLTTFRANPWVASFFKGARPAVVALIAAPLYSMGKKMRIGKLGLIITLGACVLVTFYNFSPVIIICTTGAFGLTLGCLSKYASTRK